jgi:AraC-like DNA-binding protein
MVFVYYALHYLLQKDVAPGRIINICLQGICFSALIVTFFLPDSNSEVFQSIITRSIELEYPWYYPDLAGNILMQTATLVGFLIMAYEIILQFNWKIIWKDRQKKGIIRDIGALFLFILTFHALLWALVFIASSHEKYSHWLGILNILEVGSYFLSLLFLQISPFFIQVRLKAHGMEKKKSYQYLTSRLNDNDVDMLEKKLAALNEFEKIFLDENLTLVRLAQLTGVSAKQLSEYLNRYQEMNFQSYLQHLRLDFAKKMITENPDMSIAKICYLSGFNSLASFYRNFRKHTGQTPLDFQAESTEQPK